MPVYSEAKGFSEGIGEFDSIGHIILPELNFRPAYPDEHFPTYDLKDRFAFVLNANLTIKTDTCYRFTLVSDDGSLLWINDSLSIDNGGMHKWKIGRDTIKLAKGKYNLRLWYYNAVGPCGLAFKVDEIDPKYCLTSISKKAEAICLSFDEDDFTLDAEHREKIDSTLKEWKPEGSFSISITGYADAVGSNQYNDVLSLRRAEQVGNYLSQTISISSDALEVAGKGEVENIEKGCRTTRSVVVEFKND